MIFKKGTNAESHHFEAQIIQIDCFHWQIKLEHDDCWTQ